MKYRTVLILRNVQHLSITETAQVLSLSEANVKTRLCRARLQMRDALAPGFDLIAIQSVSVDRCGSDDYRMCIGAGHRSGYLG
jgi:RNA polymerase sigma-70 factor (ECF subfamily)